MKQAEAEKIRDYQQRVQKMAAEDFKDKPDPVWPIRALNSYDDSVIIEWEKPCDNNEDIVLYNIYVSESKEASDLDVLYQTEAQPGDKFATYRIPDLESNTIYYVRILAVNAVGEGYQAD